MATAREATEGGCPSEHELLFDEGAGLPPPIPSMKSHSSLHHAFGGLVHRGWGRGSYAAVAGGAAVLLACAAVASMQSAAGAGGEASPAAAAKVLAAAGALPPMSAERKLLIPGCSFDVMQTCSALDLLENPGVVIVAAENLMRTGHGLLGPSDERQVRESVAAVFKNMSLQLNLRAPKTAHELRDLQLSEGQWNAVLGSLRLISDPRVQSVGLDVARAVRGSGTRDPDAVRRYIEEKLQPRLREMQQLRSELISGELATLWDEERHWAATLEPLNIRAMQTPSGHFVGEFVPFDEVDLEKKQQGIFGGTMEEVRALLDVVRLAARAAKFDFEVPAWATFLDGRVNRERLSCELTTLADNKVDAMKAIFCPLKFGVQGMDALRAVNEMARVGAAVRAVNEMARVAALPSR